MRRVRSQDGFTLPEVLVTMAIGLIVFAATLNVLDVFSSDSQAMAQRNDAQNQARLAIDRIVRQLRNIASPAPTSAKLVERATPWDIVFETVGTPSSANPTGRERVRYCIPQDTNPGTAGDEVLYAQTQTWDTSGSDPGDQFSTTACPDLGVGGTNTTIVASNVMNRYQGAARDAFTFASDQGQIDTVGIDLFVNPTPRLADAQTQLQSAAFLRNQEQDPVAYFTYSALGSGSVLLNAGGSYSPTGDTLSYSWNCSPTPCSSTGAVFAWNPGHGTYTVTLTVTDQGGLSTQYPEQVTVQ
jgi:prepilin-type N-terminal cleavage/methylation domain-containing protein